MSDGPQLAQFVGEDDADRVVPGLPHRFVMRVSCLSFDACLSRGGVAGEIRTDRCLRRSLRFAPAPVGRDTATPPVPPSADMTSDTDARTTARCTRHARTFSRKETRCPFHCDSDVYRRATRDQAFLPDDRPCASRVNLSAPSTNDTLRLRSMTPSQRRSRRAILPRGTRGPRAFRRSPPGKTAPSRRHGRSRGAFRPSTPKCRASVSRCPRRSACGPSIVRRAGASS